MDTLPVIWDNCVDNTIKTGKGSIKMNYIYETFSTPSVQKVNFD